MIKILIATPMYGGMCLGEYTRSMINVAPVLQAAGISHSVAFVYNDSLITSARNKLATLFMKTDCTHLLFIDADIAFDAKDIVSMVAADKDVIAGVYPKKRMNWARVEMAVKAGVPTDQLEQHAGDLVIRLVDDEMEREVKITDPVEVWGAGTGFMLIKRGVFEALYDKIDHYEDEDGSPLHEYFFLKKDVKINKQLTEDYAFCAMCRDNGIKIHAAPWARLTHTGTYTFNGSVIPAGV